MRRLFRKRNFLILALILLLGVVVFRAVNGKKNSKPVETAKVERKDLVQMLSVSGVVQAEKKATLNFPAPGKLAYVNVVNGDLVKKGQILAALDLGDLAAQERAAYYSYLSADANAKAVEDKLKGKETTETFNEKNERVAAQTARDKTYDAWLSTKRAMRNARLVSPIDGVVTDVTVSVGGDTVSVTDGITVADPASISFETEVNEADISKVFLGQEAVVSLDAYPNEKLVGWVKRVAYGTKVGETGATVLPIWIEIPKEKIKLFRIGLNGEANLTTGVAQKTLVLPAQAVRNKKVKFVDGREVGVETGMETDFEVEVKSGVKEGDIVIIQ